MFSPGFAPFGSLAPPQRPPGPARRPPGPARRPPGPARRFARPAPSRRPARQPDRSTRARTVGAVVIGGDYQGLGIIRSLGRRGVPTCVVDDEHSIGRFSRYATHAVKVPDLRDENRTVQTLIAIGHRLGLKGWVLYPTREETVAALSRRRVALSEIFRVPTPDWNATRWAWDKRNTYRMAGWLGIPAPRTWYPIDASELSGIDLDPPFVVKPAIKEDFLYATKAKAWRANSREELRVQFGQAAALVGPGQVMIQELIPGDGRRQFACCAFVKEGEMVATMVARRRRQHPPEFGRASTFVETVDVPELERMSARFFSAIRYSGLAELEYKLDPRTDEFKLLDFNARTWGYHSLGVAAGVDFPYLQFADQIGEPVTPVRARVGTRWIRWVTDLPTAVTEIRHHRLGVRAYLRSLASADTEAVLSRDDPVPTIVEVALIPYLACKRGF
jgi:D-aspartate ligase